MFGAIAKSVVFVYLLIASIGGSALFATVTALYFGWVDLMTVGEWLQLVMDRIDLIAGSVGVLNAGAAARASWPYAKAFADKVRLLLELAGESPRKK